MREQIAKELQILETHLHDMKCERDGIMKERDELSQLKNNYKDFLTTNSEEMVIKNVSKTNKHDKSTLTELSNVNTKLTVMLNNNQEVENCKLIKPIEERGLTNLVNCIKKRKKVNNLNGGVSVSII